MKDDLLIAIDVSRLVRECRCRVIGPVGRLGKGLASADQTELDGAVLDIHLGRERVWPLAGLLDEHRVPFIFLSGYARAEVPERFCRVPLVSKPVTFAALRNALSDIGLVGG